MNPNHPKASPARSSVATDGDNPARIDMKSQVLPMLATATLAAVSTLFCWVVLVSFLDRPFREYEDLVWSASLWLSAMLCSGLIAYSRHSVRPVLSCTMAFGAFGLIYAMCEGPIYGNVAAGGDPTKTQFVVWNLAFLPFGVFMATEFGTHLALRRHALRTSNEASDQASNEATTARRP